MEYLIRGYSFAIFFNEKKSLDDDIASLGIFFAYIAIERNDTEALIKQELYLRALKPQYTINNFDFQKHIRDCVHDLKSVVSKICIDYNIKNSLFVGMSMSLFQWIPAYVVGSILKELNPNLFITVGGIGNPEQAQAFIRSFKYINLASWGEGEFFVIDLAKRLLSGKDLDTLSQCYFRKGNAIVKSSILKKEYKDLDKLAYNDFSDFFNVYKGKHKDIMDATRFVHPSLNTATPIMLQEQGLKIISENEFMSLGGYRIL